MTRKEIARLWGTISVLASAYGGGNWIATQTTSISSPFPVLLDGRPVQGSVIAVVAIPCLAILTNLLLWRHATMARSAPWTRRIPQFWIQTSPRPDFADRSYSGCIITALVLLPLASLVHFGRKIIAYGTIVDRHSGAEIDIFEWVPPTTWLDDKRYRIGNGLKDALEEGATFYPIMEPALIALLVSGAFVSAAVALAAVFASHPRKQRT